MTADTHPLRFRSQVGASRTPRAERLLAEARA
jgi:hypothetical protein